MTPLREFRWWTKLRYDKLVLLEINEIFRATSYRCNKIW